MMMTMTVTAPEVMSELTYQSADLGLHQHMRVVLEREVLRPQIAGRASRSRTRV